MNFDNIYNTYWNKVFRVCMGYVNDPDWANDIAQETFITVWEQLPKFRNESAIGTWVFRIASNKCLRQIESQKKLLKSNMPLDIEDVIQPNVEGKVQFLYKCISNLNELDRLIISLELEDVKQSEIASIVGLSESNIRVKLHRIKSKLSLNFKKYEQ